MAVQAKAKNIGVSPKKVRQVLDVIRGKRVEEALELLHLLPTPTAAQVAKVVNSAAANAENNLMMARDQLRIVSTYADPGIILKRIRARPRGRVGRIKKRRSHITVVVDQEVS